MESRCVQKTFSIHDLCCDEWVHFLVMGQNIFHGALNIMVYGDASVNIQLQKCGLTCRCKRSYTNGEHSYTGSWPLSYVLLGTTFSWPVKNRQYIAGWHFSHLWQLKRTDLAAASHAIPAFEGHNETPLQRHIYKKSMLAICCICTASATFQQMANGEYLRTPTLLVLQSPPVASRLPYWRPHTNRVLALPGTTVPRFVCAWSASGIFAYET